MLFVTAIFMVLGCEPECEKCEECDTGDTEIGDELPPVQSAIVKAAWGGSVVILDEDESDVVEIHGVTGIEFAFTWEVLGITETEFKSFGLLSIREVRSALATCPALGLPSPTYDWFCMLDDPNGNVIARDETPDENSFQIYDEYPSEEYNEIDYPSGMISRRFFSSDIYQKHWGGPWQAMRGIITAWGAGWNTAREARCNSPVFGVYCNQE